MLERDLAKLLGRRGESSRFDLDEHHTPEPNWQADSRGNLDLDLRVPFLDHRGREEFSTARSVFSRARVDKAMLTAAITSSAKVRAREGKVTGVHGVGGARHGDRGSSCKTGKDE